MDIKKKLDFYKTSATVKSDKKTTEQSGFVAAPLAALREHYQAIIEAPEAPYLKITRNFSLNKFCDTSPDCSPLNLRFLSKGVYKDSIFPQELLFFDLETTGLAGGAGTFAFLLGFGTIEKNTLIVDQYFLRDYGREYILFQKLQDIFKKYQYLVSFNGKSYDLPLLKNRFIVNRLSAATDHLKHIDLLHIARRIWKDSLASCNLGSIEMAILNRERRNDIPGMFIPQAYFNFLRSGVIHEIISIIEHNYLDIISLAELIYVYDKINKKPSELTDPKAALRLAYLAFKQSDAQRLRDIMISLKNYSTSDYNQATQLYSLLCKREKKWPEAVSIWEELISDGGLMIFAFEELAKYYEHIQHDFKKALYYTQRALNAMSVFNDLGLQGSPFETIEAFNYRLSRLNQKLS